MIVRLFPTVVGEVVETYQKEGGQCAKVALRNLHIELPLEMLEDAHLGDSIRMDLEVGVVSADVFPNPGLSSHNFSQEEYID